MAKRKIEKKEVIEKSSPIDDEQEVEKTYNEPQKTGEEEKEENKKKKKKRGKTDVEKADNEPLTAVEEEVEESKKMKKKKKQKKKREEIEVKIETVGEHPDKASPIVGYFPSGFDPLNGTSSPPPEPRVTVFRHVNRSSRLQLAVSPNGSQVDFIGTNYTGEAAAAQACTYALGVLDKATQTLKIVPIAANKIFRLEPRVWEPESTDNEPSDILKEELTAEEKAERKADQLRELTLMYSTKKTIGTIKKFEDLNKKQDPKSQEDLNRKLERIEIDKKAFEVAATTNARNIPPHNMSATIPQMAYPLDKIIFKGEWDYLLDILELSFGAEVAPDVYPSFVCNRVHKLEYIEDEEVKQRLACIFSYITHLIKFKDKHSMDGVSSAKYHKIPSILSSKFSAMFADPDSKRLSNEKNDLLISYVLVLTLFVDDFRTDPSDIARDLRLETNKLRPHIEHLGCKFVREQNVWLATLPVPLQFPTVRKKRQRRTLMNGWLCYLF